ncbi:uncharacterized protein LOC108999333 [Juglans regia]|uniref:Uncharacterized protein LOC108999333 n=1 Tax=Juglans regia TaxID=51240 RepID=A0A6P9ELM0_JUGRE|nr:uncharacterized protein LOC108999333 [Juglans regia]
MGRTGALFLVLKTVDVLGTCVGGQDSKKIYRSRLMLRFKIYLFIGRTSYEFHVILRLLKFHENERKLILMAVTTQSFTNNFREQPRVALDCNTSESNDSSLITTNDIGVAHDQGFPTDFDDVSNNFNNSSKINEQGFFFQASWVQIYPNRRRTNNLLLEEESMESAFAN